MNIELLIEALNASWCRETAYQSDQQYWSEQNRTCGQCTVTAMIVSDFFGGELIRGFSTRYRVYHYWNVINNAKIDLTFQQFKMDKNDITFERIVSKKRDDLLKISNVKRRYLLLKHKVDEYLIRKQIKE